MQVGWTNQAVPGSGHGVTSLQPVLSLDIGASYSSGHPAQAAPRLTVFTKAQSQWELGFHSFTSNSWVLSSAHLKHQN